MVRVKLFAMFREEVGSATVDVDADTIGAALRVLETEYDLGGRFLDENGEISGAVTVMKNGTVVTGPDTVLADGDTLTVSPPVTGG